MQKILSPLRNLTTNDNCILPVTRQYIWTVQKIPVARSIRVLNKVIS